MTTKKGLGTTTALAISSVAILSIAGIATTSLLKSDLPIIPKEPQAVEKPEDNSINLRTSQAMQVLEGAVSKLPKGWESIGNVKTSPQSPYPFSCVSGEKNMPKVNVGRTYKVGGDQVQIVATAFGAGLGAEGLDERIKGAKKCSTSSSIYESKTVGTEGYKATVVQANQSSSQQVWRHGDVVIYLITNNSSKVDTLAKTFHQHFLTFMGDKCINPDSKASDAQRSPWAIQDYTGFLKKEEVDINKVPLPKIPQNEKYVATPIPAKTLEVKEVNRPIQPSEYPVWPLLPDEMNKPVQPESPEKAAIILDDFKAQFKDNKGPGCGWEFTKTNAPAFDQSKVDKENFEKRLDTFEGLVKRGKDWQGTILTYWKSYDQFSKDVPKWEKYGKEVKEVKAAWAVIEADWNRYWSEYAEYERLLNIRNDFLQRQALAKANYENALQKCEDLANQPEPTQPTEPTTPVEPTETTTPVDPTEPTDPSSSPTGETETPAPPTEEVKPPVAPTMTCPPIKPAIIDQAPPAEPKEPTKPKDPRPEDQRD